jgi:hypothetical protein
MDGDVIVDGNHRYIAAKILGKNPDITPGPRPRAVLDPFIGQQIVSSLKKS